MSAAKPSLWQPLIKAALPGTAQSPPPGKLALPELEAMLAAVPAETPEARLLHQAAAIAVYDRAGEPCRACGSPIRVIRQGQRATYYCQVCQKF